MPDPKRRVPEMLTPEREVALQASIANDPDNPELTDEEAAHMLPASEALSPELYAALTRPRGRPKLDAPRQSIKLRLDPEALSRFRATGAGWQTRINEVVVQAAKKLAQTQPVRRETSSIAVAASKKLRPATAIANKAKINTPKKAKAKRSSEATG